MASDDDEDLVALREAALATMKKKPAAAEDAQPIPQLTSSGHSLNNTQPAWEDDFAFEDPEPFQDHVPVVPFPQLGAPPQPQFSQPPPRQFPPNRWPGPRPGAGPVPQGNFNRFTRGRGHFRPNQRPPFVQNQRPPFGQRMSFPPNQRPPFPPNQRLPFNPSQPPPSFDQNPMQFVGGPPCGGGGNLIVINTVPGFVVNAVPEPGEQIPRPPGQRLPFPGGVNPRGRGGGPAGVGRGAENAGGGDCGSLPQVESSSKPILLRPQDKYCPSADTSGVTQQGDKERVHRKKKDKFSRYNSSDDDTDDESEEESDDDLPSRRQSVGGRDLEENEVVGSDDIKEDPATLQKQPDRSIPDAELSIVAVNTSHLDSEQENAEPELDEPVVDTLSEPLIDSLGEPVTDHLGDVGKMSEPDEDEEDRLLASPSRQSDVQTGHEPTPVRDESPLRHSPVGERSPGGGATPVRDESFENDRDATPLRDESPERDPSLERTEPSGKEGSPEQNKSPSSLQSRGSEMGDQSGESGSDSGSESEEDSGSDSGTSSSGSSSGEDSASKSSSNSASSEGGEADEAAGSPLDKGSDSDVQVADMVSDSESDDDRSVRRLPAKRRVSTSPRREKSLSDPKPKVVLTPEEQARLEARRRKFESRQEVNVTGSNRTISLKGIVSRKSTRDSKRQNDQSAKNTSAARSGTRTVAARTSVTKSKDADSHNKHARRKVSIEKAVAKKSDNTSETENKSESQEEDEDKDDDGGSRSWRREANRNAGHRKTIINQSLSHSGSYHGNSYRDRSRNGRYYKRDHDSFKDNRPEVHYSSSDNDDQDGERKLISIVVPRSSAGTQRRPNHAREEPNVGRSRGSNRKRTSDAIKFDHGTDRHSPSRSKRLQDCSPGSDGSEKISVVISGDQAYSKAAQSSRNRLPVHQRLGRTTKWHSDSSRSRSSIRPVSRNQSDSASGGEGNDNELEQRIRRIQKNNKAIMRRQKEVLKDRELYG